MKILVFSQYFYPENFRINILCRELVRRGHQVTVLTGYPQYPIGRIYEGYGFDIPYEKEWEGVHIERVRVHPRGNNALGMLRNCIDYVVQANRWVRNCKDKYDAVYVFEVSPVTVGLPAVTYKKKFHVPMIFNLQDLWPENVEEVLGIRIKPVTWVINRIVDRIYSASDKILCSSNSFVKNLQQRGVDSGKLIFWPQFCRKPDIQNMKKPECFAREKTNVVFAGNLGDAQGLDLLLQAANQLKEQPFHWYLLGDGRARTRLEKLVLEYDLADYVTFVGRLSEDEADRYVHFADFAYLSFQNNKIFDMTLPAKLQTYLACGTPILAAAGGESAQLIAENKCGVVCVPELEDLISAAKTLIAMKEEDRRSMSEAAMACYNARFTMDMLVDQLLQIMDEEVKKQECSE